MIKRGDVLRQIYGIKLKLPNRLQVVVLGLSVVLLGSVLYTMPVKAAIAYRSASSASNAGNISLSLPAPSGIVTGDVIIISIDARLPAATDSVSNSAGTIVRSTYLAEATLRKNTYVYVVPATIPANFTFTFSDNTDASVSSKASAGAIAYSGVDTINPVHASNFNTDNAVTTMTATGVTTTIANSMIVATYGASIGATVTSGSGMTLRYQATSTGGGAGSTKVTSAGQDAVQASAGASGDKIATLSTAALSISHTIALTPKFDVTQAAYRWFQNGTTTVHSDIPVKITGPATPPSGAARGTAFSADGVYMSVAHSTSPFISIYKRSGDTFTKLADPTTLPPSIANGTAFSPDGVYLSVVHPFSPFITIYKRSGDTFTKLADPVALPTGTGVGVAFSPDSAYMTVAHSVSPYITIYKRSGDTFTKLADPTTLPTGNASGVTFSADGVYMSVSHDTTPFITIYKRSSDTFTKLADPAALPAGNASGVTFSADGTYMTVTHSGTPAFTIYKRSGDTFTKLADPAVFQGGLANEPAFSPDGVYMSLVYDVAPFMATYKRSGDTFTKLSNPTTLPPDISLGISYSPDSTYVSVAHNTSPYLTIYKHPDTQALGAALAANNTSATAPVSGTPFRLRLNLGVSIGDLPGASSLKLRFVAKSGASCSPDPSVYNDITTTSLIKFYDNTAVADGVGYSSTVNDPTRTNIHAIGQTYKESNLFNAVITVPIDQDGLWDFALTTDAAITPGTYCLLTTKSNGTALSTYTVIPELTVTGGSIDHSAYRLYQNADSTAPGTPLAAQNTAGSIAAATPFRLRQLLGQTAGSTDVNSGSYKLQYSLKSGTCDTSFSGETYEDITGGSTGHIVYHNNVTPADNATISSTANDPVNGARPIVLQTYRETDPFSNSVAAIPSGSDGLWDFALTSVAAADTKTYCVRTVKSDGSLLTTYNFIPEITFGAASTGPTINEQLRGGQSVKNGTKQPFSF